MLDITDIDVLIFYIKYLMNKCHAMANNSLPTFSSKSASFMVKIVWIAQKLPDNNAVSRNCTRK